MDEYIPLKEYAKHLNIVNNDIIMISSDVKRILFDAVNNNADLNLNDLIDGFINTVGVNGTILIPTYNWDFCSGKTFDITKSPCKTGSLGTTALKRNDFKRTKHPIYSFAVYGKYQEALCTNDNKDSFGVDSPFAFLHKNNAKNVIIDVDLKDCFTFAHYAEQNSGCVNYRYIKEFSADYIDYDRKKTHRTYSMFVRDYDLDVNVTINPIENDFINEAAEEKFFINSSEIKLIELSKAYDIMLKDIKKNNAKKLCTYVGQ